MPKSLRGYGAEFYRRVGRQLISVLTLTELDRESFITLCGAYDLMMQSLDSVNKDGINVRGSKDEIKKNPALTTYKNSNDIYCRLMKKFYLTPDDRKGVKLQKPKKDNVKQKYFD